MPTITFEIPDDILSLARDAVGQVVDEEAAATIARKAEEHIRYLARDYWAAQRERQFQEKLYEEKQQRFGHDQRERRPMAGRPIRSFRGERQPPPQRPAPPTDDNLGPKEG